MKTLDHVVLFFLGLFFSGLSLLAGCGSAGYDQAANTKANALKLSSVVDSSVVSLNQGNCAGALTILSPFYNSLNTNNDIRLATASTYGCFVGLKVFNVVLDLVNFSGNLGGSGFWEFLVKEFPSTSKPDDRIPQSAESGTDAIISAINSGAVVVSTDLINSTSFNPGALLVSARTDDANTYLTFLSMSLMGSLLYRNGAPLSNYQRSAALPWLTAAKTAGDGCALASGALNFYDGVTFLSEVAPAHMATVYTSMSTLMKLGLDSACALGCTVCGGSVSCTSCPLNLRDRTSCKGLSTDVNSCAAAGIAFFINSSWAGTP